LANDLPYDEQYRTIRMSFQLQTSHAPSRRVAYTPPPPAVQSNKRSNAAPAASTDFKATLKDQLTPPPPGAASPLTPAATLPPASVASLPNGGLMVNPTGNLLNGGSVGYNPNYYASLAAATQLAQQLGGTVVDRQGQFANNQAEYYIDLPNGTSINAGNLVAIYNNPCYQGNAGVMDHMVAELLNNSAAGTPGVGAGMYTVRNGQIGYDPAASAYMT
jgi:hypothetical protein